MKYIFNIHHLLPASNLIHLVDISSRKLTPMQVWQQKGRFIIQMTGLQMIDVFTSWKGSFLSVSIRTWKCELVNIVALSRYYHPTHQGFDPTIFRLNYRLWSGQRCLDHKDDCSLCSSLSVLSETKHHISLRHNWIDFLNLVACM